MTYEITRLDFGGVRIDESMRIRGIPPGNMIEVPAQGYLVRGHDTAFLVDAGYRDVSVLGAGGTLTAEHDFHRQLASVGLAVDDLDFVVLTHAHRDHAGHVDKVPLDIPVVLSRTELATAASGIQGHAYARDDVLHLIRRLYTPGALRVLDLEPGGWEEIAPGVTARLSGGHTAGSLALAVPTSDGVAYLCGDLLYDVRGSLFAPPHQSFVARVQPSALGRGDPGLSNNFTGSVAQEIAAVKLARQYRFVLAAHDAPAVLDGGRYVGRIEGPVVPGPITFESPPT
jgi:glyoxylase-like metal-dependent hydrolase (beta-lactamase superfamily II)